MINPKKELFKWGPLDGHVIYGETFMHAFPHRLFDKDWPECILFYSREKLTAILENNPLREHGKILFTKYILPEDTCKKYYHNWEDEMKREGKYLKCITLTFLASLSDADFAKEYDQFKEIIYTFWNVSFLPEFANWGGEEILKEKLQSHPQFIEVFELLTAPEDLSFYQKEEMELMQIKLAENGEVLIKNHQQKWFWIENSYAGSQVKTVDFFKNRINLISKEEAEKKIAEIKSFPQYSINKKREVIKKYQFSEQIVQIAHQLSFSIWWQDFRKSYNFINHYYIDLFLNEAARRTGVDVDLLRDYTTGEISLLLNEKKIIPDEEIIQRNDIGFVMYFDGKRIQYTSGAHAKDFVKFYFETGVDTNLKEFKGMVVCRGKAKGKVKIILSPKEIDKMEQGDILVAPMTSPDYIFAMRKASAIITDEGGMTCHAAIVARELNIPCIVATKIATRLLKDNDLIEVDAETGIVKKL